MMADQERREAIGTIGRVLVFGGCGALLLLGILLLLKLPAKARIVIPSLVVAAASIVLGLGWLGWTPGANWRQIAMTPAKTVEQDAEPATAETTPPPRDMRAGDAPSPQPADPSALSNLESSSAGVPADDF